MSHIPDLANFPYQIIRELGHNRAGGRVTYLATHTQTQDPVAIKQFQFARADTDWSGYDAYEREINVLRQLNHPGIPRYLDSFETSDGFCLVQEYKQALPLSTSQSLTPKEVKQVAIELLEILVYLQDRFPPVIHRDIKPENILVGSPDESGRRCVYLVDFGLARIGQGEVAASSMVKGTLGFMPPEQLFNRQLTEASDLYGLGASLVCLLTGTPSARVGELMDNSYHLEFKQLVPQLSLLWTAWLEKLVQPNPSDRYPNAAAALAALKPIDVTRSPQLLLSSAKLEFQAQKLGERMTQTIVLHNPVPDTQLSGCWQVAPHPSDPPHRLEAHPWIAIKPAKFEADRVFCQVTVDTGKLMADRVYRRELLLLANVKPDPHTIAVEVKTAPVPLKVQLLPYPRLFGLLGTTFLLSFGFDRWWPALLGIAQWMSHWIDRL
jgi:serine/threonine protein kinase